MKKGTYLIGKTIHGDTSCNAGKSLSNPTAISFFLKNATNAIKLVSFVLWKSHCMLNSLSTLTMFQAAFWPFLPFNFFFPPILLLFLEMISFPMQLLHTWGKPRNTQRQIFSIKLDQWMAFVVLWVCKRAQKGRTVILESFKPLKNVKQVLSQPEMFCWKFRDCWSKAQHCH